MAATSEIVLRAEQIDWAIIDEHIEEAAYLLEVFVRALRSPVLTLTHLVSHPERLLAAHLDALVIGGPPVFERALVPLLEACDGAAPHHLTVAAMVAIEGQHSLETLWPAVKHDDPVVRGAVVRAVELVGTPAVSAWISSKREAPQERAATLGLLDLARARQLPLSDLTVLLEGDDPEIVEAAAEVAVIGDREIYLPTMMQLTKHPSPRVRDTALLACLAWRAPYAWATCERRALDPAEASVLPSAWFAALGDPNDHEKLLPLLESDASRARTLFALGFSGNVSMISTLVHFLASEEPKEQKLAAQALATIVGFDLMEDPFARAPAPVPEPGSAEDAQEQAEALPPLEEDDLEGDLVPASDADLPMPNQEAISDTCQACAAKFDGKARILLGERFSLEQALAALERLPMAIRPVLAHVLWVRTENTLPFNTEQFASTQEQRIAVMRASNLRLTTPFYAHW